MENIYIHIKSEEEWNTALKTLFDLNVGIRWPNTPRENICAERYPSPLADMLIIYTRENKQHPVLRYSKTSYYYGKPPSNMISINQIRSEICNIP